jgi:hydrogenase nickel incorporation protein HypA/HybF
MHELTIASALVEQVCAVANARRAIAEVNIRMGVLRGIARSLYFCFPSAARGTLCEDATLNIEEVPLVVMCNHCDAEKTPAALYNFRCPDCGRPTPKVLKGREMQLLSVSFVSDATDDSRDVATNKSHVISESSRSENLQ